MILLARGVFLKKNGERYYPAPYMPIGSIYLTVSNDNPSTYFGGTWEKMSGGYLYACVNSIGNSSYTGSSTQPHTLTIEQIPAHSHGITVKAHWGDAGNTNEENYNIGTKWDTNWANRSWMNFASNTGGGQAHSHNIAYIGVWCWKRIA